MKYLLIEHNEGKDPATIHICNSEEERIAKTREAILGPDNDKLPCPEIETLQEDRIVTFEGDPPVSWIEAEISDGRADFLLELLKALHVQLECPGRNTTMTSYRRDGSVIISHDLRKRVREAVEHGHPS